MSSGTTGQGALAGLTALVTGGASGIGAAVVERLLTGGARVAVLDRDTTGAHPDAVAVRADVSDDAAVRAAVAEAVEALGGLTTLVNNAGIGAAGTVADNADEEWHRVFDVNVLGAVRVTRAALPHLREAAGRASVVTTCSVAATVGLPQRALYSATKGALVALTRAMARTTCARASGSTASTRARPTRPGSPGCSTRPTTPPPSAQPSRPASRTAAW